MDRLTFEGNFCDIAMCREIPGGSFCEDGYCSQRKVWERLKAYEDTGLEPETIKETLSAVNGGLAAENGIWCPKCGDALDIDIVNGVLAIGCFGCGEYTPISELMKLHLNDAVPVVRCKDCVYKASAEVIDGFLICPASGMEICDDDFCSYGERKENYYGRLAIISFRVLFRRTVRLLALFRSGGKQRPAQTAHHLQGLRT